MERTAMKAKVHRMLSEFQASPFDRMMLCDPRTFAFNKELEEVAVELIMGLIEFRNIEIHHTEEERPYLVKVVR